MPSDMEQMQLLMALSLYLNSIKNKQVTLVPVTPEMLFGNEASEGEDEDAEYEYEDEEELEMDQEDGNSPDTRDNSSLTWKTGNRLTELSDDDREAVED